MAAAAQAFAQAGFQATPNPGTEPMQQNEQQESAQQADKPVFQFTDNNQEEKSPQNEFVFTQNEQEVDSQEIDDQPAFDPSVFKNILNGRFESAEELEEYVGQLESREPSDEIFANNYIRSLNDAVRAGIDPEVFAAASQLNLDEVSPKEALIMQYQLKDGLSWEDAEILVNEMYRLDDEAYSDDDPATKSARIKAKVDANAAYEYLAEIQQDALIPPREKQIEMQVRAWDPVIPQVMDSFKTLEFEGKAGKYQFPVSEQSQQEAANLFRQVIESGIVDSMPNDEGIEFAMNLVHKEIVMREAVNMLDTLVEKLKLQQITSKHNPSRFASQGGAPAPDEKSSLYEFLAAQKGLKYNNY